VENSPTVLTKTELISSLRQEVHILLHLMSKIEPYMLEYRPSAKQRNLLELLQYLTLLGPIHTRGVLADTFSMDAWRNAWTEGEGTSKTLDPEGTRAAIAGLNTLFDDLLENFPDDSLREDFALFGRTLSRGSRLVGLVLNHYVAYRMQVFLYLKEAGCDTLSIMNLWAGEDA